MKVPTPRGGRLMNAPVSIRKTQVGLKAGSVFSPILCYRRAQRTPKRSAVSAIVKHASDVAHACAVHRRGHRADSLGGDPTSWSCRTMMHQRDSKNP